MGPGSYYRPVKREEPPKFAVRVVTPAGKVLIADMYEVRSELEGINYIREVALPGYPNGTFALVFKEGEKHEIHYAKKVKCKVWQFGGENASTESSSLKWVSRKIPYTQRKRVLGIFNQEILGKAALIEQNLGRKPLYPPNRDGKTFNKIIDSLWNQCAVKLGLPAAS